MKRTRRALWAVGGAVVLVAAIVSGTLALVGGGDKNHGSSRPTAQATTPWIVVSRVPPLPTFVPKILDRVAGTGWRRVPAGADQIEHNCGDSRPEISENCWFASFDASHHETYYANVTSTLGVTPDDPHTLLMTAADVLRVSKPLPGIGEEAIWAPWTAEEPRSKTDRTPTTLHGAIIAVGYRRVLLGVAIFGVRSTGRPVAIPQQRALVYATTVARHMIAVLPLVPWSEKLPL